MLLLSGLGHKKKQSLIIEITFPTKNNNSNKIADLNLFIILVYFWCLTNRSLLTMYFGLRRHASEENTHAKPY